MSYHVDCMLNVKMQMRRGAVHRLRENQGCGESQMEKISGDSVSQVPVPAQAVLEERPEQLHFLCLD